MMTAMPFKTVSFLRVHDDDTIMSRNTHAVPFSTRDLFLKINDGARTLAIRITSVWTFQ